MASIWTPFFINFKQIISMTPFELFNFKNSDNLCSWEITDDVVMGGKSNSRISLNENHNGVFEGRVSTENNGGFSSVRYRFKPIEIEGFSKLRIKIKSDNHRFQLRLKEKQNDKYSYIQYFETNGEWQDIEIQLKDLYPTFRGNKLEMPNFKGDYIEEIGFLIGNNKHEDFRFEIESIYLI